jgi:hypothetical protein
MKTLLASLAAGLLALNLSLFTPPVLAATVAGLYEAEVPIAGEDPDSRNQAIAEALALVLVKLTGRDPAPGTGDLATQASRFVQQFRYRRDADDSGETQTRLWVRFDKSGLDRALRERGLPLWGSSRPAILLWLAAEGARGRALVAADSALGRAVDWAAAARGLPLQWPLLDLEDRARLTAADLWSDYAPAVTQASARYVQPLVLTGRLRQVAADHWEGRWTLYEEQQAQALSSTGRSAADAVRAALGTLAELLASRYAPAGGGSGPQGVWVRVEGVQAVGDYARVLRLIGDRELVDRVAVRDAAGDALLLEVSARGGRDALARVLDLARELSRQPDPPPMAQQPAWLRESPVAQGPPDTAQPPAESAAVTPAPEGGDQGAAPVIDPTRPPPQPAPAAVEVPEPMPVDLVYRLMP